MRNLFKLSFFPLLKIWRYYLLVHLCCFLYFFYASDDSSSLFEQLSGVLAFMVAAFSPFLFFLTGKHFIKNISWLTNSFYSKKKLLSYYLIEQLLRLVLTLSPFFFYLISEDVRKDFFEIYNNFYYQVNLYNLVFYIFAFISIVYIIPLVCMPRRKDHSSIQKLLQESYRSKPFLAKTKYYLLVLFISFLFLIIVRMGTYSSHLTEFYTCVAMFIIGFAFINMYFKILPNNKANYFLFFGTVTITVLYLCLAFLYRADIKKEKLSNKNLFSYFFHLEYFSPKLTSKQARLILKQIKSRQKLGTFIEYQKSISKKDILENILSRNEVKRRKSLIRSFLGALSKKDQENKEFVTYIYLRLAPEIKTDYDFYGVERWLHRFILTHGTYDTDLVEKLLVLDSRYSRYIVIELIQHFVKGKDKQADLLIKYKKRLPYKDILHSYGKQKSIPQKYNHSVKN